MNRTILCVLLLFSWKTTARGEDIFVAQSALGANTGVDAANAHSLAWLNTAANWGTGTTKVSAGDTVHLVGTFTGTLTTQGNGTPGSPITILFEPGAKFVCGIAQLGTENYYGIKTFISANSSKWVTIDGGTNGLINCTDNGTSLLNQTDVNGVSGQLVSHFTVQNLTVTNMYRRDPGADGNRYGQGVNLSGDDILIQGCTLSDGDTIIAYTYPTGTHSNLTLNANTILNCNHGITLGASTVNPFLNNVIISSNRIDYLSAWDGNSGLHLDGVIVFNESPDYSGCISNLQFYANYIGPNVGTITTAAIFIDVYKDTQISSMSIRNNVFTEKSPYDWSNGFIRVFACTNSLIANNTFIAYGGGTGIGFGYSETAARPTIGVTNNLFLHVATPMSFGAADALSPGFHSDYNIFADFKSSGSGGFYGPNYNAADLSWWKAQGYDIHSVTNSPLLDASYKPTALDTVARDKGVDLGAFFNTDKNGVSRPQGPAWDIGAYEFRNSATRPAPPQNLRILSGP